MHKILRFTNRISLADFNFQWLLSLKREKSVDFLKTCVYICNTVRSEKSCHFIPETCNFVWQSFSITQLLPAKLLFWVSITHFLHSSGTLRISRFTFCLGRFTLCLAHSCTVKQLPGFICILFQVLLLYVGTFHWQNYRNALNGL